MKSFVINRAFRPPLHRQWNNAMMVDDEEFCEVTSSTYGVAITIMRLHGTGMRNFMIFLQNKKKMRCSHSTL